MVLRDFQEGFSRATSLRTWPEPYALRVARLHHQNSCDGAWGNRHVPALTADLLAKSAPRQKCHLPQSLGRGACAERHP